MTETAGRRSQPQGPPSSALWHGSGQGRQDDTKGGSGDPCTHQDARRGDYLSRGRGIGHAPHAGHIAADPGQQNLEIPIAVCEPAGKDGNHAPGQILYGQGEGQYISPPAMGFRHRLHENTESGPVAHGQDQQQTAADEHG